MENQTIFRDRQELQDVDLNNLQDYARNTFDHLIADGIQDNKGWVNFTVVESGTAELTVSQGRIYVNGAIYVADAETTLDLLSDLPVTNKRWCAVVSWGTEEETDVEPRDFLTNAEDGSTEPSSVPMRRTRKANIGTVLGVAAPQPVKPSVAAENVVIAWVLLNTTGIESITMETDYQLPQVARTAQDVKEIQAFLALVEPRISALASDLAKLTQQLATTAHTRALDNIAIDVARLKEFAELEDNYSDYGADRFLDTDESDTENVNYLAKVEEGVRFADEAAELEALELFNPLNPDVTVSNGLLLPKYTEVRRFKVEPFNEEYSISQHQFQTHNMVQKSIARERIRYGETVTVCTNDQWWKSGRYDSAQGVFYKDGDTWELLDGNVNGKHEWLRLRKFFKDTYTEFYWDRITTDHTINGQQIAQTFMNGQDGWLTSIGLYFTQKGSTGNVDVALSEVKYGQPDLNAILNKTTLNVDDIQTSGDGTVETKVAFPATFLEAGKRYAIILTTGGNHYVALALGTAYAQGTFFYSVDGAYQQGVANKDLMFSLYYANFNKVRTVVDLEPLSLSGGISYIDILAPVIAPESTDLQFELQVAGTWHPLAAVSSGNTPLSGLPPLIPFRAVFNGTTDVQPGINLLQSVLRYSRPRTTFKHISTEYILAAPTQTFKVVAILENYYETNHNLSCSILLDGEGEPVAPATTVDVELDPPADPIDSNHKRIKRTFTWTDVEIAEPMESVKIILDGSTTSALDTFLVSERIHLAFPVEE